MPRQKLIVLSGLPGTGKSTLATGLSQALSTAVFSVDPIEAAMWRSGISKAQTGIAAYEIAATLANDHLKTGHSVIVDAVNPVEAPRAVWRKLAETHHVALILIECICTDPIVHRNRIVARVREIEGMPEITWDRVLERQAEYEPWNEARLILDTSNTSPDQLLMDALTYLR